MGWREAGSTGPRHRGGGVGSWSVGCAGSPSAGESVECYCERGGAPVESSLSCGGIRRSLDLVGAPSLSGEAGLRLWFKSGEVGEEDYGLS
jgi:hypothetical protein